VIQVNSKKYGWLMKHIWPINLQLRFKWKWIYPWWPPGVFISLAFKALATEGLGGISRPRKFQGSLGKGKVTFLAALNCG
jgi:hypothetical protein